MKSEKTNMILRVLLPLAAISMIAMAIMKESWIELLLLPMILLAWYDSYKPIEDKVEKTEPSKTK
jgi:hypothetical protein